MELLTLQKKGSQNQPGTKTVKRSNVGECANRQPIHASPGRQSVNGHKNRNDPEPAQARHGDDIGVETKGSPTAFGKPHSGFKRAWWHQMSGTVVGGA